MIFLRKTHYFNGGMKAGFLKFCFLKNFGIFALENQKFN